MRRCSRDDIVSDRWVRLDFQKLRRIIVRADPVEKDLASLRSGLVAMATTKTSRSCTVLGLLHQLQFIFRALTLVSLLLSYH
jgi:hypothetical protein